MLRAAGFERRSADGVGEERWALVPAGPAHSRSSRLAVSAAWAGVRGWLRGALALAPDDRGATPIRSVRGGEDRTAGGSPSVFHPPGVIRLVTADEEAALRRGVAGADSSRGQEPAERARSVA
jgi:hypothetical protein